MSRSAGREAGFSLVEVLVAVVILGLGFTAVLGALAVAYSGSNSFRDQSNAKTVAISAAERVKTVQYADCAQPSDYLSTARLVGNEYPSDWGTQAQAQSRIDVTAVRYWNGTTFVADRAFCLANPTALLRIQQVVITASSPDGRATEVVSVTKRGPA